MMSNIDKMEVLESVDNILKDMTSDSIRELAINLLNSYNNNSKSTTGSKNDLLEKLRDILSLVKKDIMSNRTECMTMYASLNSFVANTKYLKNKYDNCTDDKEKYIYINGMASSINTINGTVESINQLNAEYDLLNNSKLYIEDLIDQIKRDKIKL